MTANDARALRAAASRAVDQGGYEDALEHYLALEDLEPTEGEWARRVAQMFVRLGDRRDAIAALERAAVKYTQAGFENKANAIRKLIERVDPEYAQTQQRLIERYATPSPAMGKRRRFAAGTQRVRTPPSGVEIAWAYHWEISKDERVTLALSSLEPSEPVAAPTESAVRRKR